MCANLVKSIFLYENFFGKSWDAHLNTTKRFHSSAIIYIWCSDTIVWHFTPKSAHFRLSREDIALHQPNPHICTFTSNFQILEVFSHIKSFHTLDVSKSDNIYNTITLPQKLCLEMEILQKYQIFCKNTRNTAKIVAKFPRGSRKCADFGVKCYTMDSDHQI